jgi:predicted dehydrogenase
MMRRALVLGFGSIGKRHASILAKLGLDVSVVSRRGAVSEPFECFESLDTAFAARAFDYVVVATETAVHASDIKALGLLNYCGPVLVEKPLLAQPGALPTGTEMTVHVGYQLRFHPVIRALRERLGGDDCIAADFYVGQHLDRWRGDRDSRDTYSSHAALGGGVLRDLSHELDLAAWLFGACNQVTALGGRLSGLTVDSDDAWGILGRFERCPVVTLQLNYLDRIGQRSITVVTSDHTIRADLVAGTVTCDGVTTGLGSGRDEPIEAMHRAVLDRSGEDVCGEEAGLQVVNMIAAIERAAQSNTWICP